jgi:hypothetical protein
MALAAVNPAIVVGVDRSQASDSAVRWAAREAGMRNVALTLVHACPTSTTTWSASPARAGVHTRLEMHAQQIIADALKLIADSALQCGSPQVNSEYSYRLPRPRSSICLTKPSSSWWAVTDRARSVLGSSARSPQVSSVMRMARSRSSTRKTRWCRLLDRPGAGGN